MLPQMQFLSLPQIDAAVQQKRAAEMQNALAPYVMQKYQLDSERGAMEMQALREQMERQKQIRDAVTAQYTQPEQVEQPPSMTAAPSDPRSKQAVMLRKQAEIYSRFGDVDTANKLHEQALKLEPKFSQTPQYDQQGNAFVLNEQGMPKYLEGIKARDKVVSDDLGGQRVYRTEYSVDPIAAATKTQTPDSVASNQVALRGQNLTDARGREANRLKAEENQINKQGIVGKQVREVELMLQDDYRNESKGFAETSTAMKKVLGAIETADKNPGNALAAGTAFMKLLDPNSVVRESELGMALNASGWFDRALNIANTLQAGKVMTPKQKENLKKASETLFQEAKAAQLEVDAAYKQRAEAYGADPSRVIVDRGQNAAAGGVKRIEADAMPNPAQYVGAVVTDTSTGIKYQSNGSNWVRMK